MDDIISPSDKYIIDENNISIGGPRNTFKGTDLQGNIVVIKKHPIYQRNEIQLKNQINILQHLHHPNIIKLIDSYEEGSNTTRTLVSVFEYCENNLETIIQKQQLQEHEIKYYISQIVCGLKYLREKKIVHRNLKPSNILIKEDKDNNDFIIKISDLNFANIMEDDEESNDRTGTPLYMAPEIILGSSHTNNIDLYSIGIILYEMVTNSHPYNSATTITELGEYITKKPIIIQDSIEISESCKDLIYKLVEKDPKLRISWNDFFNHPWFNSRAKSARK